MKIKNIINLNLFTVVIIFVRVLLPGNIIAQVNPSSNDLPSYPLFGIVSVLPGIGNPDNFVLTGEELFEPLRYYRGLYRSHSPFFKKILDGVKQYQPQVKVISYMHGYTNSKGVAGVIERDYLHGIAMTDVTTLVSDLDSSSSILYVEIPSDGKLPVLASTADVSSPTDPKKFLFWIRVNDEKMKVLEVDSLSGMLTVERGFYSTIQVSHARGTRVMAPMYQQPDRPESTGVRYMLDPAHDDAARYKTEKEIFTFLQKGYDGVWLDCFSVAFGKHLDPLGRLKALGVKCAPWDFRNGRRYTGGEVFAEAMYIMLENIRKGVTEEWGADAGPKMYIGANQFGAKNYLQCNQILPRNARPEGLDAFCMEDLFVGVSRDAGSPTRFFAHPVDEWLENMSYVRQAAHDGSHVIAMITAAGQLTQYFSPVYVPNYEELDRFGWCSYLLAVTPEKTISFGRPVMLWNNNDKLEFIPLGEHYFLPIGNPTEDKVVTNYAVGTSGTYARRFENAVVFVNPSPNVVTVPLTGTLNDVAIKLGISTLEMKAHDGMIVMTTPTDVRINSADQKTPFNVWSANGKLSFEGIREGDLLEVYSVTGMLQHKVVAKTDERSELDVPKGFYIIQSGNTSQKVIIY